VYHKNIQLINTKRLKLLKKFGIPQMPNREEQSIPQRKTSPSTWLSRYSVAEPLFVFGWVEQNVHFSIPRITFLSCISRIIL